MIKFKVWNPMDEDEGGGLEILADDAEQAAEMYMEDYNANNPLEGVQFDILVRDVKLDTICKVQVDVDWSPTFYGQILDEG